MLKKVLVFGMAVVFALSLSACGKQEKAEQPAPGAEGQGNLAIPQKGQEAVVQVPEEVKKAWKGIKLQVVNKTDNSTKEFTVDLGKEANVPGTKLTVKAVEFLPSFVMQGLNITSASNTADNPAAKVVITEAGNEVFKGWLFQKFPETHAFSHPQYSVTLVQGISAK